MKSFAKSVYSRFVYARSKKSYRVQTSFPVDGLDTKGESFFGYYDKSPSNSSGLVLGHCSEDSTAVNPFAYKAIKLALFSPDLENILWSTNTRAYNWQQGARLHWLNDEFFIYNDFNAIKQRYMAKVVSSKSLELVKQFDYPVQDSYKTDYFISLNYQRLMTLRPDYGYRNLPPLNNDELNECEQDGLWRVDFETGKSDLLISITDARKVNPRDEFDAAVHKFNHVMISPNGERFIFMHRYLIGKRRFDRLLLADAKTGALKLLSDFGMVSHCFWADDNTVLGYMRGPEEKDGYWLLDVDTGEFTPFAHEVLSKYGDGHPHVVGDWFITDTYPDKARMQHLLMCNWKTGEVKHVGEFLHGFQFSGETRCDLHPRLTPDGKAVYFDSVFTGERKLYRMELS
ncbi:glycosyl transferase [Vibrio metschnikovii]|nr:glycosyl transferase [Vibrio metschnikovii]EKO3898947.1 glycosyl transferase [Vibrio metschnikovii]